MRGRLLTVVTTLGLAAATSSARAAEGDQEETSVKIQFDDVPDDPTVGGGAFPYAPPIEQLMSNAAIANGLASGADALNRSVESLMDSLFYSLLDNEHNFYVTDEAWFSTSLKRDVYSTPTGAYVIMDRFQLGPRFAKELWKIHSVPISLGVDGTVEVLQIYLRTDGMRLAEQEELSPVRRWVNSWFGLLPLFSAVLPPSFNQNELYDPVTQLKTPGSFPLDQEGFFSMPIGSIRSYALSGGIQVGADFGGMAGQSTRDTLERIGGLTGTVPYAIFKRGEHRINVLRRSEQSAWVGVKDLFRVGHSISPFVGRNYHVFRAALAAKLFDWDWVWAGVPIAVLPIDLNFEQAIADLFDQVYEYDMRNPSAREAYEAAVKGDFLPSRMRYLDQKEKGLETGVVFHFARIQDRTEEVSRNGPNLAVYKRERKRDHGEAEVEITDTEGKFYVLESSLDVEDKTWDVLVGDEQGRVQQSVEMKVRRIVPSKTGDAPSSAPPPPLLMVGPPAPEPPPPLEKTGETNADNEPVTPASLQDELEKEGYTYAFEADPDPYRLTLTLNIQDRYVDTVEYYKYMDDLRFFTGLAIAGIPKVSVRDAELEEERRRRAFFTEPTQEVTNVHVTPTYLGRLGAQASLSFSTKQLERIIGASESAMWAAFAKAYGADQTLWGDGAYRESFRHQLEWFGSFFLYPTRLLNIRIAEADAIKEASHAVAELASLKVIETPLEKLSAFNRLLDTDYPRHLAKALLELADINEIPRRVVFSAQPKGTARHEVKAEYGRLNNMVFKAGPGFPEPTRYARSKAKLANFYLDQPREAGLRPHIVGIGVTARQIPASVRSLDEAADSGEGTGASGDAEASAKIDRQTRHVYVNVRISGLESDAPIKLYVRVEQAGRIKIGKLELAEKVLELQPVALPDSGGKDRTYEFYLTGPLSALNNYMFNQAVGSGDEFLVTLAASGDGAVWSDERSLEFRFDKGKLTPPK